MSFCWWGQIRNSASIWLHDYICIINLLAFYSFSPMTMNLTSLQEFWLAVWEFEMVPAVGFSGNPCCCSQWCQTGILNLSSWKSLAFHPCWILWKACSMSHSACASLHIWQSKRYCKLNQLSVTFQWYIYGSFVFGWACQFSPANISTNYFCPKTSLAPTLFISFWWTSSCRHISSATVTFFSGTYSRPMPVRWNVFWSY